MSNSSSGAPPRFDSGEARQYWEVHQHRRARANLDTDPHALANVCEFQVPAWLNEHHAAGQRAVFRRLLSCIPQHQGSALDLGCGGARWSEELSELGWDVTGIDLQAELIDNNRKRLPQIRFERIAIQDFQPAEPFDLVCSVTVLGHIPHEEHAGVLEKLRSITESGARLLLLENIREQTPHVFANSVEGWTSLCREAGFTREQVIPYDFNPCLRALAAVRRLAGRVAKGSELERPDPERFMLPPSTDPPVGLKVAERAYSLLMNLAGAADRRLDPLFVDSSLTALRVPPPVHAGMVFAKT